MVWTVSWRPLHHEGHDFSAVTLHCSYWKLRFGYIFLLKVKVEVAVWGNCGKELKKKKYVCAYLLQTMTSHTHPLCHHYPPPPPSLPPPIPDERNLPTAINGTVRRTRPAESKCENAGSSRPRSCCVLTGWHHERGGGAPASHQWQPAGIKTAADAGGKTDLAGGASWAHALTGMNSLWRLVHLRQADRL